MEEITEEAKSIKVISKETVHHICSGQVVLDLSIAIKELVENSLDSGATSVDIKLVDYGKTCITVIDNGIGVLERDYHGLALKHHTSKIRQFADVADVCTFGFRGEALSSLCALGDVCIITKHQDAEYGHKLKFDRNGALQTKTICARDTGTTVQVSNIFKTLPVRAKDFEKNIKREYGKALQILYAYCLISTGVKITCANSLEKRPPSSILSTNGSAKVMDNMKAVFGRKALDHLTTVELQNPDEETLEEFNLNKNVTVEFTWEFYISSCEHSAGRSTPDRQFFFVNGRPCDLAKISKLINTVYRKYNGKQYPFVFLDLKLNQNCADVNVTPDKRTIYFTQEKIILATIKSNLTREWDKMQGVFTIKTLEDMNFSVKRQNTNLESEMEPPKKKHSLRHCQKDLNEEKEGEWRNVIGNTSFNAPNSSQVRKDLPRDSTSKDTSEKSRVLLNGTASSNNTSATKHSVVIEESNCKREIVSPATNEYIPPLVVDMKINFDSIKSKMKLRDTAERDAESIKFKSEIEPSKNSEAERELQRQLDKSSFTKMIVIGQFNLGFIVSQLNDEIFIIDQHATDEKYRFEKLNKEIKIKTQKLIIPKPLNLAVLNETILLEHRRKFEDNGFTFNINEEGITGQRVQLTGMPVSGSYQFGQEDVSELIFMIREGALSEKKNQAIRPTRVRDMLASRACRSAVMIGTALSTADMYRLVNHMSEMDSPWNCPHGRPTIRHLISLSLVSS